MIIRAHSDIDAVKELKAWEVLKFIVSSACSSRTEVQL